MKISQIPEGTRRRMTCDAAIPLIEVADDADPLGVGRPDGEVDARHGADGDPARAELVPRTVVRAFAQQVQVEIAEDLAELVGVDDLARAAAFVDAEAVGERLGIPAIERDDRLEESFRAPSRHRDDASVRNELHAGRRRLHRADDERRPPIQRRLVPSKRSRKDRRSCRSRPPRAGRPRPFGSRYS